MIKYPINEPNLSELEKKYVLDVLASNWLSAGGNTPKHWKKNYLITLVSTTPCRCKAEQLQHIWL